MDSLSFARILCLFMFSVLLFACSGEDSPEQSENEHVVCKGFFDIYQWITPDQEQTLKNCTHIAGGVWIRYLPAHQDLSFLNNVTRVDGDFIISQNQYLENVDGLQKLQYVGGRMEVDANDALAEIELGRIIVNGRLNLANNPALKTISAKSLDADDLVLGGNRDLVSFEVDEWFYSSDITIYTNPNLSRLPSFQDIEHLQGSFLLTSNDMLEEINGLERLRSVQKSFSISSNAQLKSGLNLTSLRTVGGSLSLYNSPSLTGKIDLSSLVEVHGSLAISANENITELEEFNALEKIGEDLIIHDNPNLSKVGALAKLSELGGVSFKNNPLIYNLPDLSNIVSFSSSLVVQDQPLISDLKAFSSLRSIAGSLKLVQNPELLDLNGLNNLLSVGEDVLINSNLQAAVGLSSLQTIGDSLLLEEPLITNPELMLSLEEVDNIVLAARRSALDKLSGHFIQNTQFVTLAQHELAENGEGKGLCLGQEFITYDDAKSCVYIEGALEIADNESITDLSELNELLRIEGHLTIENNRNLNTLSGMEFLQEIGGNLHIKNNDSLIAVDSFDNVETIGMGLTVKGNPLLRYISGFNKLGSVGQERYQFLASSQQKRANAQANSSNNIIRIENNPQFENLSGFNVLSNVPAMYISNSIFMDGFESLLTAKGLSVSGQYVQHLELPPSLMKIEGNLSIYDTKLVDLTPFNHIVEISGSLRLDSNQSLGALDGFDELLSIGGEFIMFDLPFDGINYEEGFNKLLYCGEPAIGPTLQFSEQERFLNRIKGKWHGDFCGRP